MEYLDGICIWNMCFFLLRASQRIAPSWDIYGQSMEYGISMEYDAFSMAMQQEPIDWRYLPYMFGLYKAYVREYPHNIWP